MRSFFDRMRCARLCIVRDSSAVRQLFFLLEPWDVREFYIRKQRICLSNSWSAHFHVLSLSDFIFYQKPLYKSLHQSFFYSFITILPSESGVTLHYSTILSIFHNEIGKKFIRRIDMYPLMMVNKSDENSWALALNEKVGEIYSLTSKDGSPSEGIWSIQIDW
jgi:hypothetical protein